VSAQQQAGKLRFDARFSALNRNVPAREAVAATRGFGKTRNLPLTGSNRGPENFYFG
jgi:hypothetical protein